jgi:hypothetical protein
MPDPNSKPRVFVGSSVKGLDIARHARAALTHDANVELWEDALFKSTNVPVENLLRLVQEYDFALFILHPEDKATIREEEEVTVRDNVILELGLFLGTLGRSHVFFIAPQQSGRSHRDRLYLPTDLSGITPPEYDPNAPNPRSSVANSLDEFRRALKAAVRIEITSPREGEELKGEAHPERADLSVYEVRGRLKRQPADHEIWLLTEDDRFGKGFWPQGFRRVLYDPQEGEWIGYVSAPAGGSIKITAVVAPPSSRDFFQYYERVGRKTDWEPLNRIPVECTKSKSVQALAR